MGCLVILRELQLQHRFRTRGFADETFLEAIDHVPDSQHEFEILRRAALKDFAVDFPFEIDRDLVAVRGVTLDRIPGLVLIAQCLDHFLEIRINDFAHGFFDFQGFDRCDLDRRVDFERRGIAHAVAGLDVARLDARFADRTQLLGGQRFGETRAQDFTHDFLAHPRPEALLHDAKRYLAWSEAVDFYRTNKFLQAVFHLVGDPVLGHADGHFPLQIA